MNNKKYFFVDAETDGLYGKFLSIAALAIDENGAETEFYASVSVHESEIETEWVRDNVYPYLSSAYDVYETEHEMLEAFWKFWIEHKTGAECVAYVAYPVEARLFNRCAMNDAESRTFEGPFPLYDLSTLLIARGYDADVNMAEFSGLHLDSHDAMNDVRMLSVVWQKLR